MKRYSGLLLLFAASLTGAQSKAEAVTAAPGSIATEPSRFEIPATDDGLPGAGPIRRYDSFRKKWRERRTAFAGRAAQDQGALVFLGDSIIEMWGEELGGNFPGVKTANRGISGDTTRGMLIRLQEDVLALHPRGIVFLAGTNDLAERAAPEMVAGNLKLILAAVKAFDPKLPVIVCQVLPSSPVKQRPAEQIRKINECYAATVKGDSQVTFLDTWTLFADAAGDAKVDEFPDLLHPNAIGYAKWAAALRPVLATLGYLEKEPDGFVPEAGFESLFNGCDLSGWGFRVTSAAEQESARKWQASDPKAAAWPFVDQAVTFDGQQATPDGRYVAVAGRLVVRTPPEGRKIQQLWTTREFPTDFVLKLEFRATPNADSGIYVRGPQLQCRDYLLAGPYKELKGYRPQDWNEIVVEVKGSVARCTCNGEVLEAAFPVPASGPLGLEGDRGQMEYRHIRIKVNR
jgi:lysophospholipase L1-like esterase